MSGHRSRKLLGRPGAYQRAVRLFREKSYDAALLEIEHAIESNSLNSAESLNARRLRADLYVVKGQPNFAAELLADVLRNVEPGSFSHTAIAIHRASILLRAGDIAGAATLDVDLLLACPDINSQAQAGYIFTLCEQHESALRLYRNALQSNPDNPQLLFNCASACRAMGELEEAEVLYDRAIQLAPNDWEAYKNRSDLRRQSLVRNHLEELHNLQREHSSDRVAQIQLNFALAKELEDLGRTAESFHHLQLGSNARRAGIRYKVENDLAIMSSVAKTFDLAQIKNTVKSSVVDREQGKGLVFVLGMPRTGTTLVDRLLTSVPNVVSAGEPDTFARLLAAQVHKLDPSAAKDKGAFVSASATIDFDELGLAYSNQMMARAEQESASVIIDKNPMNFLYVGLIQKALPAARIIHLQRDPIDTCYAIYKTLFKTAYPFSYDQQELGHYYVAYRQLMQHWREVLPGAVYDLQYEKLVSDLEDESKRLFEFCDLSWSREVLAFHQQSGSGTATASAAQVRQPVYRSSIGKWKNYSEQLQPLIELLEHAGISKCKVC